MASTLAPTDAPLAVAHGYDEATAWYAEDDIDLPAPSLVFRAAGRVYACAVTEVREVAPLPRLTRLPGGTSEVMGLINLRGEIVTVLDAGGILHGCSIQRDGAMLLVVDWGSRGVGLAVERVADVRALRSDEGYQYLDLRATVARFISITEDQ